MIMNAYFDILTSKVPHDHDSLILLMEAIKLKPENPINLCQQSLALLANHILKVIDLHPIKDTEILIAHGLHDHPIVIRVYDELTAVSAVRLTSVPDVLEVVFEI